MLKNLKSISTATKYKDVAKIIIVFSGYSKSSCKIVKFATPRKTQLEKLIDGLKLVQLIKDTGMNILMY